jgi:hypothetical protein
VQDVTARRILLGTSKTEEDTMSDTVTSVEKHATQSMVDQDEIGNPNPRVRLGSGRGSGRLESMEKGKSRSFCIFI